MSPVLAPQATIADTFRRTFPRSAELSARAKGIFPNGVTHDGRHLEPFPVYVDRAAGCRKHSVDGPELIDCWSGHGALLLGHSHPDVVAAVQRQAALGTHFGACHELEIEWAEAVRRLMPACERVRFTSSGTEATLMALRIARIVTGRAKTVKFAGHFHGWHDFLVAAADPPHDDPRYPVPGVPEAAQQDLVVIRPNDLALVERTLVEHKPASVIVEATGGRWGVVPLAEGFLRGVQDLARKHGVLFVLDEVISGFRVHPGGTQGKLGLEPDLTTLAKVLAGGLPGGCVGGRADVLDALAYDNPRGRKMKHPGTFNACPLSAAAGIETLRLVATGEPGRRADSAASAVRVGLNELFARKSVGWAAYGESSYVKILPEYDGPRPTGDGFVPYGGAFDKLDRKWDSALGHAFRCGLLLGGVDWMGWSGMFSAAHGEDEAAQIVSAFDETIDRLRVDGLLA